MVENLWKTYAIIEKENALVKVSMKLKVRRKTNNFIYLVILLSISSSSELRKNVRAHSLTDVSEDNLSVSRNIEEKTSKESLGA